MAAFAQNPVVFKTDDNPLGIVFGRFMTANHSEHACQVIDLDDHGATFLSADVPAEGESLVAYVEELGRVEAIAGAARPGGFAVGFALKGPRLERLQERIRWLKERGEGKTQEHRRHTRFEPTDKISQITLPDGRIYPCEVLDISVSGAAIKTDVVPSIGTYLVLGKMRGRVVRYIDQGIGVEFLKQLEGSQLSNTRGATLG